jgi:hypothetical protein
MPPRIPRGDNLRVGATRAPNVRVQTNLPVADRSPGDVLRAAGETIGIAGAVYDQEKRKADDLQTQTAYSNLRSRINDAKYNANDGLITYTGKKSFGAVDVFRKRFDDIANEVEGELTNSEQKAMFRRMREHDYVQFDQELQRHVGAETLDYTKKQTSANLMTLQEDAALNYHVPGKTAQTMKIMDGLLQQHAADTGMSPEELQLKRKELSSGTHVSVMSRMLLMKDDAGAKKYLEGVRAELTDKDLDKAATEFRAFEIERERVKKVEKEALVEAQKKTQNEFLSKLQKNQLTAQEVDKSNLDPFGSGSKDTFFKLIETEGKDENSATANDLFRRIHLPEGHPEKIVDENVLNQYVIDKKISKSTLTYLRNEIQGQNTEAGKVRSQMQKGLYDFAEQALVKKNPMMGLQDPQGEYNLSRFRAFVNEKLNEAKKAGKSGDELFNPNSKEYVGQHINQFVRSPQEVIKSMLQTSTGASPAAQPQPQGGQAPVVPATTPAPAKPVLVRKPGESAQAFLERRKAAEAGK